MKTNIYHILPTELTELHAQLEQSKEGVDFSRYINLRPKSTMDESGIATIHITGGLMDNCPQIFKDLGCTDYRDIRADISQAIQNGAKGIVFYVNSPGGQVAGAEETAQIIAGLPVPAVTFYDGLGCSAAFKLGVGTDYSIATPSSQVGNVGTILSFVDSSKVMEAMGYEIVTITNDGADLKDTFHKLPLTEIQKGFLADEINEAGTRFQMHVENHRDIDPVYKLAGWYSGEKAVSLGFTDELGDFQTAYDRLSQLMDELTPNPSL